MNTLTLLALATALAGCTCIHLASPNQRWRHTPLPAGPARGLGALLLAASWRGFAELMQATPATFTFATVLMLLFVLLPYVGALIAMRRAR
ncbi:hypothetical protein [Zoogloea dura]|uniref:Uncharacterized protein n=1 Tax=Zoogloea dura TaxID=2728840 RepID=A0A848G9H9_9RHOO|nr:hypothetical protein [Zoogloea dura]NML26211.1 hypothetical protein [Zoogloea dura]